MTRASRFCPAQKKRSTPMRDVQSNQRGGARGNPALDRRAIIWPTMVYLSEYADHELLCRAMRTRSIQLISHGMNV